MTDTIRVLYVDDEPGLLNLGKIFLETGGEFVVDTLTSATEALTRLTTERYDAIISDYQMPVMDGIAFLKQLKATGNQTPFIIFTGRGREEIVIEALNNGADFYLQKGGEQKAQFAELSNKIRYAVTRRRAEEHLENVVNSLTLSQQVAHIGSWTLDLKNQLFDASEEALQLFGYPAGSHPTFQDIAAQIHPDDRARAREALTRLIETGEPYSIDIRIFRHDTGEMRVIHSRGQILARELGKPASVFGINLDITDRKNTEEELIRKNEELNASYEQIAANEEELRANMDEMTRQDREIRKSEERYRQFFKTTLDSVFMTTPDGQWLDCNDALVEIFGYESREEVFRVPVASFYAHPEERSAFLRIVERDGFVREHPMQFRKKDGTIVDGLITIVPWKNPDGSLKGFIGTVHDITRRKEAERKLQESENRYRHIFESLEDLYYQTDMDGLITVLSPSVYRLSGYTPGELIGKPATDLYANPKDRANLLGEIAGKGYVRDYELLLRKKDGALVPVSLSAGRISHPDGTPAGIAGTLRDITRRRNAENAALTVRQNFEAFFNTIDEFLFVLDVQGHIIYTNETVIRRLGYSREELADQPVLMVHPPERRDEAARTVQAMLAGTRDFCPVPLMTKGGHLIPVETRVTRGEWDGKPALFGVSKDISELKLSEEKFSAAFHSTATLMALSKKTDGKFIDVNEAFLQTLGFTCKEVIGKSARELELFVQPENRDNAIRILEETGRVRGVEIPIRSKDGSIRSGIFSVDSLIIGEVPCLLTTLVDITERKRAEGLLADRLVFQQALINSIPYPVFIKDASGRFVGCNQAYEREFKTTQEYLQGKTVLDLEYLPLEERQRFQDEDMEVIATAGRCSYELSIVYADGMTHQTLYSVDGFHLADGRPGGLIGMLVDITERKIAEEELRRISDRLALATRAGGVGIWDYDVVNNTLTWDDQMFALYGITRDQFSGVYEAWTAAVHPEDRERGDAEIQMALRGEKAFDTEFRVLWPDGSIRTIRALAFVQRNESTKPLHMIGTNWDISERKRAEEAVLEANKKLNMLNSITRHDVLNQITELGMILGILTESVTDKESLDFVRNALDATDRITRQIEFTKEYQDIGVRAPQWQNVSNLITAAQNLLATCPFEVKCDTGTLEILADPLLNKVFYNLLENAVRHGERVNRISFFTRESDTGLTLICEDNGNGIDEKLKKNLFRKGFGKHTGFGLYLIKDILAITSITITETGEPGKGARFEMAVPKGAYRVIHTP